MTLFLKRPYPFEKSSRRRMISSMLFGLFVFLFLFGFQPFRIDGLEAEVLFVAFIFGMICTVSMLFLSFVVVELFPRLFSEKRWTILHELCWVLLHCAFIGLMNAFFAASVGMGPFSLKFIGIFELYTLAIGIFPITVSILVNEMRLSAKYKLASQQITSQLHHPEPAEESANELTLPSDNRNEDLTLHPEQILFLEAADNYVRVHYLENGTLRKHLLRTTMKSLGDLLGEQEQFIRVHKSYLVNGDRVERVSGNAQGYKLHFERVPDPVPVARKQNELLRNSLSFRP